MSKEAKNEIDLMLRQLARRKDAARFESDEQHLDADELNSYVANALPAAARARYMEHLVDCASCRKLVAQLSAAEGPVIVQQKGGVPAPSFLKQFLAGLFSPMVMRYAVPALGVLLIMVVGFVVMRREQEEQNVAALRSGDPNGTVVQQASPSAESKVDSVVGDRADQPVGTAGKPSRRQLETPEVARNAEPSDAPVAAKPAQPSEEQPLAKSAPAEPPPAPKVASTEAEGPEARADRDKKAFDSVSREKLGEATVRQREEQNKAPQPQTAAAAAPGSAANRSFGVVDNANRVASPTTKRARVETSDKAAKDDDAVKEKNEDAAETRSVAGRRFRKSGNVWIDTAYDSSRQTFNMTRGSEPYRTLIGDEPEIRKIAEQLDGEFIVVWKGRAYRIR